MIRSRSSSLSPPAYSNPVPHINEDFLDSADHHHVPKQHHPSLYTRDCLIPMSAASLSFVASFFGALMAVSLPTHVAGYYLETLRDTILLWSAVASGFAYAMLAGLVFFEVMAAAVNERYGSSAKSAAKRSLQTYQKLQVVHLLMPLALLATAVSSAVLFYFGLTKSQSEWSDWCSANSVIITDGFPATEESKEVAVRHVCEELFRNQRYLVLAAPIILAVLELARFLKVRSFIKHLKTPLDASTALSSLSKARRRGHTQRRRGRRDRRERTRRLYEDEKELLDA